MRTQEAVAESLEIADTPFKRVKGLLGRSSLPQGAGLWIEPCASIHMFFMSFAIDVIYLNQDRHVVKLVPGLKPWRCSMAWGSRSVVELPAGALERLDIQEGDLLEVREPAA